MGGRGEAEHLADFRELVRGVRGSGCFAAAEHPIEKTPCITRGTTQKGLQAPKGDTGPTWKAGSRPAILFNRYDLPVRYIPTIAMTATLLRTERS